MKNINLKSVVISAVIAWILAVLAFIASYFFPVMSDPDLQANWVLSIFLIPAAALGAHMYYRKGYKTNGFVLGISMFLVAMVLDALFTVPFLVMPYGGTYLSFFSDPGFWLIAVEYISIVAVYWQIEKAVEKSRVKTMR